MSNLLSQRTTGGPGGEVGSGPKPDIALPIWVADPYCFPIPRFCSIGSMLGSFPRKFRYIVA